MSEIKDLRYIVKPSKNENKPSSIIRRKQDVIRIRTEVNQQKLKRMQKIIFEKIGKRDKTSNQISRKEKKLK